MNIEDVIAQVNSIKEKAGVSLDIEKLRAFLEVSINGDHLKDALALDVKFGSGESGIVIYVLTNVRLMRIRVGSKGFESFDIYLKEIVGVNRGLSNEKEDNNTQIRVEAPKGRVGLTYTTGDKPIEGFFALVESAIREIKKAS